MGESPSPAFDFLGNGEERATPRRFLARRP